MLASTIRSLEQFKTVNGINLVDWVSFWSNLLQQEDSIRNPFLCGLIKHIQNRFDDNLMSLTQVNYLTCPKNPPQKKQLLLPSMETEIEYLAKQFDCILCSVKKNGLAESSI